MVLIIAKAYKYIAPASSRVVFRPIIVRDVYAAALTLGTEFIPFELFATVRTFCHIKSTFEKFIFS